MVVMLVVVLVDDIGNANNCTYYETEMIIIMIMSKFLSLYTFQFHNTIIGIINDNDYIHHSVPRSGMIII